MTKKQLLGNLLIFILYTILSLFVYQYTNDGLHFMLIWNLFLGLLPYLFVYGMTKSLYINKKMKIVLLVLWLIFFPNSMYIMTDLIYIDHSLFMEHSSSYPFSLIYLETFDGYLRFFHIFLGVILGIYFGVLSVKPLYQSTVKLKSKKIGLLFLWGLSFISSIAIYLGRFIRLNSWNMIMPWKILSSFFEHFSWFMLFFVLIFTILQGVILMSFILRGESNE